MQTRSFTLEVIAFTIESVLIAQRAGAHRIELCDNPADGGTTPSYGLLQLARSKASIEVFPIIRPRGGDFLYSAEEMEVMLSDIEACKQLGFDGVVLGVLQADGRVDRERTSRLVEEAYPMEVTFHRAFDRVRDMQEALETLIQCGCARVLTSGGKPSAREGAAMILQLRDWADERISIMPGAGVRSNNLTELIEATGANEFHSSARRMVASEMEFINEEMDEELKRIQLDEAEVKEMVRLLFNLPDNR